MIPSARRWSSHLDLLSGWRLAARQPVVAATTVVALALGIGLATIGFTVTRGLLWSQLPGPAGDRLVRITARQAPDGTSVPVGIDRLRRLREDAPALVHVGVLSGRAVNAILPSGRMDAITAADATPATLAWFPYQPLVGRALVEADGLASAARVAVLGERLWRREFGADPSVIGRAIEIAGLPRTIVGVAPLSAQFPNRPDIWLPIDPERLAATADPVVEDLRVLAFLREGASVDDAVRDAARVADATRTTLSDVRLEVRAFTDLGIDAPVWMMAIALGLLLLVIAANVANLILARSLARAQEFAVRTALGAARWRLVWQVFVEVLVLGAIAAPIGLAAASMVVTQSISRMDDAPFWMDFTIGVDTAAFVVVMALVACAVAGIAPALRATRRDPADGLRAAGARVGDAHFGRIASSMVVAQVALSVVALFGAVVFAQGLRSMTPDLALPDREVLAATLSLGDASPDRIARLDQALRAIPGASAAGLATSLPRQTPPAQRIIFETVSVDGQAEARAPAVQVSAGVLDALGATAVAGRLLRSSDFAPGAATVVVINEPFARKFFVDRSPIGHRFRAADGGAPDASARWHEIVGVVPDLGLSVGDTTLAGGYYLPITDASFAYALLRVPGDPVQFADPLRRALASLTPPVMPGRLLTLEEAAEDERSFLVTFGTALVAIGCVTLLLALAGLYAMMSLMATRRTREIGIRVALGASTARVIAVIASRTAWQLGAGALVGVLLSRLLLGARQIFVFRLGDGGPWTLPAILVLLAAAGSVAAWVPIRRALRIRPIDALKAD